MLKRLDVLLLKIGDALVEVKIIMNASAPFSKGERQLVREGLSAPRRVVQ